MSVEQRLYRSYQAFVGSSLGELFWYALSASAVWLAFYVVFRSRMQPRKVVPRDPTGEQVRREILHSLRSIAIFGLVTAAVVFAARSGWTRLYPRVEEYGWVWLVASVFVMIVMHDAYFYWTHRLMHHPRLFRFFHRTHHLSTNPTPWAAYAFSPAEAFVQAGIGPVIVFTIPTHSVAFAAFMVWQIGFNVLGHCGYEIFPRWYMKTPMGYLLNSVTHHAQHHEKFKANYGLYFNVWDRLMGTNHPEYETTFEHAAGGELTASSTAHGSKSATATDAPGAASGDTESAGATVSVVA